jgi:hypothetical protein
MPCFLAYGVGIRTHLDLSRYLPPSIEESATLTVLEQPADVTEPDLSRSVQLYRSHGRELSIRSGGDIAESARGRPWCFEVKDVARFRWRGGGETIHFECLADGNEETLAFWLIHIFLPLWFTLEGTYEFFHACSVEIDGTPVLFIAPSMGGKSTLTDFFLRKGHGLVSDDKVAVVEDEGTFLAIPSHPNHRPYRRFEDLGKRVDRFCARRTPIGAVYSLKRAGPEADVRITEVVGHRKFAGLRPSYLFDFGGLKEKRLAFTAALANGLPFYEVDLPWNIEKLEEVYEEIRDHFTGRETG